MAPPVHSSHAHPQNLAEIKRLRTELLQHAENALLAEDRVTSSIRFIEQFNEYLLIQLKESDCLQVLNLVTQ